MNRPDEKMREAGAAMRAHHDEVAAELAHRVQNLEVGDTLAHAPRSLASLSLESSLSDGNRGTEPSRK